MWPKWPNDWAVLWVLICTVHLTLCSCDVTYALQSEFTLYSCLNVKKILGGSRREIWSLSDCSWTRIQNHLVRKRTLNYFVKLVKWLSCVLSTYLYGAFDCMFLSCHVHVWEWIHTIVAWMSRNSLPKELPSIILEISRECNLRKYFSGKCLRAFA